MYNEIYQTLYDYKHNCFTWQDTEVDNTIIDKIVNDMYELVPSKQSKVPWQLDVLGPTRDILIRKSIYHFTYNTSHKKNLYNKQMGRPNPQSDAPYVFMFATRPLTKEEIGCNDDLLIPEVAKMQLENEIGFAAYCLKVLANLNNLDFGFCGCFNHPALKKLRKTLKKPKNWEPKLVCGIGHGKYTDTNLITNYVTMQPEFFKRPGSIKKPDINKIITKHY